MMMWVRHLCTVSYNVRRVTHTVTLSRFLGSAEPIQAVARRAISGKHNRAFLVVLAPVAQIPSELDRLFVCVDHDPPDGVAVDAPRNLLG